MNIAFLTPEFVTEAQYDGGLANYLDRITKLLVNHNHQVSVFTLSDKTEVIDRNGIRVIRFKPDDFTLRIFESNRLKQLRLPLKYWYLSKRFAIFFKKYHQETPFDILQTASYHFLGLELIKSKLLPTTTRISSFSPLYRMVRRQPVDLSNALYEFMELQALEQSSTVFGPSQTLATELKHHTNKPIEVIPSPPNSETLTDYTYPTELPFKPGTPYLLYFGTLSKLKGLDFLISNLDEILKLGSNIQLVLVGKDNYEPGKTIKQVIDQATSRSNRVHVFDKMPHKKLFPIVKHAFAVLVLSKTDNLPNTAIEAMSLGKIVIGTKGASLEEIVKDQYSGFLVEQGNNHQLVETIKKLLSLPLIKRKTYESKVKAYISSHLNEDALVEMLIDHYYKTIRTFHEQTKT